MILPATETEVLENIKIAVKVYEQYRNGDSIKNTDLKICIDTMKPTLFLLYRYGKEFRIIHNYLRNIYDNLLTFAEARGIK